MISTMPQKSSLFLKLLLIAGAIYAYQNRTEIKQGISGFLAKNQMLQETKGSLKWAYNELRPRTEAEKEQHAAYVKEQQKRREEYRKMGINTQIEYVTPEDGEKWKQAVRDRQELMKHFSR